VRGQLVGHDRRSPLPVVPEQHVVKAHRAGGEQRDRDIAAQHRMEPGDAWISLLTASRTQRPGMRKDSATSVTKAADHGGNGNREAFKAR